MKKNFTITFFVLLSLFLIFTFYGLEKRFFYINSEDKSENISIKKSSEFYIQLTANPEKNNLKYFNIVLIFNNLTNGIIVKNADVSIINNSGNEIKLLDVSATDGFYNWEPKKNGKASTFDKLPKHLKEINKEIQAYYLYSWNFKTNGNEKKDLKINVSGNLIVGEKEIVFKRTIELKLINELIFRSPIRFH